ncbi:MAG: NADH-quinone oxidoreductase subunit L, partial [Polyangiaceae bacterium]
MPTYTGEVTHIELANLPLWLIALFPFLGALTNAIFGRKLQASSWNEGLKKKFHIGSPGVSAVAVGAMLCAFVVAVISFVQLVGLPAEHRYLYTHGWQML